MNFRNLEFEKTENLASVSIVIPCFNESEGIEYLTKKLLPVLTRLQLSRKIELIIVDDGSTDDTFVKLQQYLGQQAKIIRHQNNRGLSAAITTGLAHSICEIICTIDSDCTYEPNYLTEVLNLMQGDVDIVTASPYHPQGGVKNVPAWRLFLSKSLSFIYRIILPKKLYTYTSIFRAYRRQVLEKIPITYPGFLGMVEILAEAMFCGYHVVEYPCVLSTRRYGQSKLRTVKVIFSHIQYIKKLVFAQISKQKQPALIQYKYTK